MTVTILLAVVCFHGLCMFVNVSYHVSASELYANQRDNESYSIQTLDCGCCFAKQSLQRLPPDFSTPRDRCQPPIATCDCCLFHS